MPGCRINSFVTRRDREIGCRHELGDTARVHSGLSGHIKAHHTWDPRKTVSDSDHGGIFNFDFSKNGSLLGAACERKSVLLFDPFNGKLVASKTNAHTDCVNCVKFLDDRLFATCSDDTTVALWDTRYLRHNVQTFRGHSNWVKNIEYDSKQGILLTSGFDGCIYTWNINRYSTEESSNKVFYTSGLMRSKLSPDFSKLIISTHEGYMIVVHNLDLSTLGEDLKGFKPNMYRLMQRSQTPLRIGLLYNHVFEQERNRVQFIADWPVGNDANIISSLQVHPQGWCVLSRNTDLSENTEWTCVHELSDDLPDKKSETRPWEMGRVTPHTSSAFCSSTNTPAYSSLAPSAQARRQQQSTREPSANTSERTANPSNTRNNLNSSANSSQTTNNRSGPSPTHPSQPTNNSSSEGSVRAVDGVLPGDGELPGSQTGRENSETDGQILGRNVTSPDNTSSGSTFTPDPVEIPGGSGVAAGHSQPTPTQTGSGVENSTSESLRPTPSQAAESSSNDRSQPVTQRRHLPLSRLSTGLSPNLDRHQQVPVQATGPMHNSLIQIRRGARQEDGSFSFSISVHTPSGRTIQFSQDDLNSDDEDSDIRIERIIPNPPSMEDFNLQNLATNTNNARMNSQTNNLGRQSSSSITTRDVSAREPENLPAVAAGTSTRSVNEERETTQSDQRETTLSDLRERLSDSDDSSISLSPNNRLGSLQFIDNSIYNDDDLSFEENESDHDLIEEDRYEFEESSDDNEPANAGFEIEYSNQQTGSSLSLTIENRPGGSGVVDTSDEPENLFRNSGFSRIRRSGIRDAGTSSASENTNSTGERSASNSSGLSMLNSNSASVSQPMNMVDSRPRNNSFMFVLESNRGQRRRILNLSYLDSYSEVENNQLQKNIRQNRNKLLGYVEECNVGKGFIKEVGFSSDGRLISSPFGFGLRIFAFDSMCNELCDCVPSSPVKLYEVTCSLAHVNCVVATKFSPVHNLIVSGCLDGKVAFHQPVL